MQPVSGSVNGVGTNQGIGRLITCSFTHSLFPKSVINGRFGTEFREPELPFRDTVVAIEVLESRG